MSPEIAALPTSQNWDYLTFGYHLVPSKCHMSPVAVCLLCTRCDTCLLYEYTAPNTHSKESQTHLLQQTRLLFARQIFVLTQTRQQHHHHKKNTTPAPHQQHSSRDSSRGGGDVTSPATVYVPDFQKYGQTGKQDLPIQNITTFQKSEAIMDAPYFSCSCFWSLTTTEKYPKIKKNKKNK